MFLAGLFVLTSVAAMSSGSVYQLLEGPRAATALLARPSPSVFWCGVLCLRRPDCTHWARDSSTSLCSLYPAVSSATATTIGVLYAPTPLAGYRPMPGRAYKMFRLHVDRIITGSRTIKEACARDGAGMVPAFPDDDEQVNFLKTAIAETSADFLWVGIWVTSRNGRYSDTSLTRSLLMKPEWMTPHGAQQTYYYYCVWMGKAGMESKNCGVNRGYICQYERY